MGERSCPRSWAPTAAAAMPGMPYQRTKDISTCRRNSTNRARLLAPWNAEDEHDGIHQRHKGGRHRGDERGEPEAGQGRPEGGDSTAPEQHRERNRREHDGGPFQADACGQRAASRI